MKFNIFLSFGHRRLKNNIILVQKLPLKTKKYVYINTGIHGLTTMLLCAKNTKSGVVVN